MKTVLTVLTLIMSLCSIAQADTTCELMIYNKGVAEPKKIPLNVLYQIENETSLRVEDDNIVTQVFLKDEKSDASLRIGDVYFSIQLKFEKLHKWEVAQVHGQILDENKIDYKKQFILICVKK